MAQVIVPDIIPASLRKSRSWMKEVGTTLQTADVEFVDTNGDPATVDFIQINADGNVGIQTLTDEGDSGSVYLVKGGFHFIPNIYKLLTASTDTGTVTQVKVMRLV